MGEQVKLENVRVMWPQILKPQISRKFPDGKPTFSIVLRLEGPRLIDLVKGALNRAKAIAEEKGQVFAFPPSFVPKDNGIIELRVSSPEDKKPHVVDQHANDVHSPGKIYAGCYCNVYIDVYTSTNYGNKISVGLLGVQFAADGDPLDGRPSKEDMFGKGSNAPDVDPFS